MKLASMIKSARQSAGLSQSQAATAWGIPLKTLQSWEQGQREPGALHLAKLLPLLAPHLGIEKKTGKKAPRKK